MQVMDAGRAETTIPEPMLTEQGVSFAVTVEQNVHPCVVTSEALHRLSREHGFSMDEMNTYRAFEAKINSVARSLVFRGARNTPLVIGPHCFH